MKAIVLSGLLGLLTLGLVWQPRASRAAGASARENGSLLAVRPHSMAELGSLVHQLWQPSAEPALQTGGTPLPVATGTPTPSTTPTVGPTGTPTAPPDAKTLLDQANAALIQANTYHFVLTEQIDFALLVSGNVTGVGDAEVKPYKLAMHLTGNVSGFGQTQKVDEYAIQIKRKAWIRDVTKGNKWKVDKSTTNSLSVQPNSATNLAGVGGTGVKVKKLVNLGADTFNGTPVWHVRQVLSVKVNKTKIKETVDYLIEQDNSQLLQLTAKAIDAKDGISIKIGETNSAFGEPINIKKPKIGSSTP